MHAICSVQYIVKAFYGPPEVRASVSQTPAAKRPWQKGRMEGRRNAKRAAFSPFSCFRFSLVPILLILHTPRSFSTCLVSSFSFLASLCLFRFPIFTFHFSVAPLLVSNRLNYFLGAVLIFRSWLFLFPLLLYYVIFVFVALLHMVPCTHIFLGRSSLGLESERVSERNFPCVSHSFWVLPWGKFCRHLEAVVAPPSEW